MLPNRDRKGVGAFADFFTDSEGAGAFSTTHPFQSRASRASQQDGDNSGQARSDLCQAVQLDCSGQMPTGTALHSGAKDAGFTVG